MRIVIFPNADIKFHITVTTKFFSSSFFSVTCYHLPNVSFKFHYAFYGLEDRVLFLIEIPVLGIQIFRSASIFIGYGGGGSRLTVKLISTPVDVEFKKLWSFDPIA
jgi:hypothetical protein